MQPSAQQGGRRQFDGGFTAVELLTVIAIVAVLAAVALPSFRDVIARYRVRQAVEDLTASLYQARSEAIRRGGRVVFRKAAASGCSAAASHDWSCGWSVFVDANGDGDASGDQILHLYRPPDRVKVELVLPGNSPFVTVDGWGKFANLSAFSFQVTPLDSANPDLAMRLCMASGGRLRVVKGSACT